MQKIIDIIAPSGSFPAEILPQIAAFLAERGLTARIPTNILGNDLLCANSDAIRFALLKEALYAEDSDLIWCVRGGYGAARLLPDLAKLTPPKRKKLLVGFSDITALHLFLTQKWGWETIHGPTARQVVEDHFPFVLPPLKLQQVLVPLNAAAENCQVTAPLTGGNLKLVESSLATFWQIEVEGKILMLEEVNEPAYRVDRCLNHLLQAGVFSEVKAVVFGDFTVSTSTERVVVQAVLDAFAQKMKSCPIFHAPFFGHGSQNEAWGYRLAKLESSVLSQTL
jgi:muramoyltetrapeptide carboxypeptidase